MAPIKAWCFTRKMLFVFNRYTRAKTYGNVGFYGQNSHLRIFSLDGEGQDGGGSALGVKDSVCGAVMTIQTFGDYARWHPHIHSIVGDGLFRRNGIFHVLRRISIKPLAELFRAKVLALLKRVGLIDDFFSDMIMKWRHTSGFSVDNSVCIARDDIVGGGDSGLKMSPVFSRTPVFFLSRLAR